MLSLAKINRAIRNNSTGPGRTRQGLPWRAEPGFKPPTVSIFPPKKDSDDESRP